MKQLKNITLKNVQEVYNGAEGDLWELVMGEQIHIGGFSSSMALAEKAGIGGGMQGVDLCCCNGAGMRFLVRFRGVEKMTGVDATETVVNRGRMRCEKEGFTEKIQFNLADVTASGLPNESADFIWGEDAWCYVEDKPKLISEAARIVKRGGTLAFTDWVEGPTGLTDDEANRFLTFMKFPTLPSIQEYADLLKSNGCQVLVAEDTGQFAPHVDLYLDMLNKQLTYDALKIIGFNVNLMQAMGGEMIFMQGLARAGKIAQGRFIAKKNF
ncbi:MAG: methyltransferase domain-containing protein [bacterium]